MLVRCMCTCVENVHNIVRYECFFNNYPFTSIQLYMGRKCSVSNKDMEMCTLVLNVVGLQSDAQVNT